MLLDQAWQLVLEGGEFLLDGGQERATFGKLERQVGFGGVGGLDHDHHLQEAATERP